MGHCSLRHARGRRGALIQHVLYANAFFLLCIYAESDSEWILQQTCAMAQEVWLYCQVTSLKDLVLAYEGLFELTLKDVFTGPHQIYPVFNCIGEQSVSALQNPW